MVAELLRCVGWRDDEHFERQLLQLYQLQPDQPLEPGSQQVSFGTRIPGWLAALGQSSTINQVVWLLSSMVLVQSPKCRRDKTTLF